MTSAAEHLATTAPLALLEASGWALSRVPVAVSGILDLDAALGALGDDVALPTVPVSVGDLAVDHLEGDAARIAQLRDELWAGLSARVDGTRRHTPDDACLANTLLVSFPGVFGMDVLSRVPQIAASTGSACHVGEHTPNATLLAGAHGALVATAPSPTSPSTSKGTPR